MSGYLSHRRRDRPALDALESSNGTNTRAKMQKLNEEALKRHARAMRLMREKEQARARKEQALKRELNAFVEDGPQVRGARTRTRCVMIGRARKT